MLGLLIHAIIRRALPPRYTVLVVLLSFCRCGPRHHSRVTSGGPLAQPGDCSAYVLIVLWMLSWIVYTFGAAKLAIRN